MRGAQLPSNEIGKTHSKKPMPKKAKNRDGFRGVRSGAPKFARPDLLGWVSRPLAVNSQLQKAPVGLVLDLGF